MSLRAINNDTTNASTLLQTLPSILAYPAVAVAAVARRPAPSTCTLGPLVPMAGRAREENRAL